MRIVAGQYKGRVIDSPSDKTTRPTTDRVRESMFSAVYSRVSSLDGVRVLDAFAGSGALGLEALSRGAAQCTFFERDRAARRVLESNIARLDIPRQQARVVSADVLAAARRTLGGGAPFGLVMLDPPYALGADRVAELLAALAANGDLACGALAVYEHAQSESAAVERAFAENAHFALTGMKKYGKIGVAYVEYSA